MQLLGAYSAGLALDDAGYTSSDELRSSIDLIVAGAMGERDLDADLSVLKAVSGEMTDQNTLNHLMADSLRPTLFLNQLPNMLAGNISIVHGILGSSNTFLGSEIAGVSAVQHVVDRILAGEDAVFLVGSAYCAERPEHLFPQVANGRALRGPYRPVWQRTESGGVWGSAGAFLVIESDRNARLRGARAHARIFPVVSARESGDFDAHPFLSAAGDANPGILHIMSGASGIEPQTSDERRCLEILKADRFDPIVRTYTNAIGLTGEAHFITGVALAALSTSHGVTFDPLDSPSIEAPHEGPPAQVLVTTTGQWRGAGATLLKPVEQPVPARGSADA